MTTTSTAAYALDELNKERTLGGAGATKARDVPRIDLSDFEARKATIADELWQAATEIDSSRSSITVSRSSRSTKLSP